MPTGAIIVFSLVAAGAAIGAYVVGYRTPARVLRAIARRNGWATQGHAREEAQVGVPAEGGVIAVSTWSHNHHDGAQTRGWSARESVALPPSFLSEHDAAVEDSLRSHVSTLPRRLKLSLYLGGGVISVSSEGVPTEAAIRQVVHAVATAARGLDLGLADPDLAIRRLAQAPPTPALARAALEWSLTHDRDTPHLATLIEAGLASPSGEHRLVAARQLDGARALPVLLGMVLSGQWSCQVRRSALGALLRRPAFETQPSAARGRMADQLMTVVGSATGELLTAILGALQSRFDVMVPLAALHARMGSVDTKARIALVESMARHREESEPELLSVLATQKRPVRIVALRALVDYGGVASVAALRRLDAKWTTFAAEDRAAKAALAAIEARNPRAVVGAGGLTLDADDVQGGELSDVAQPGELALEPD